MIPLTNHDFQWGRSEVVIIYPEIYILYITTMIIPHGVNCDRSMADLRVAVWSVAIARRRSSRSAVRPVLWLWTIHREILEAMELPMVLTGKPSVTGNFHECSMELVTPDAKVKTAIEVTARCQHSISFHLSWGWNVLSKVIALKFSNPRNLP